MIVQLQESDIPSLLGLRSRVLSLPALARGMQCASSFADSDYTHLYATGRIRHIGLHTSAGLVAAIGAVLIEEPTSLSFEQQIIAVVVELYVDASQTDAGVAQQLYDALVSHLECAGIPLSEALPPGAGHLAGCRDHAVKA